MAGSPERYVLERRLAIGGMAEIFLGRVAGLEGFEKKVVLKRMLPTFEERPEFVEMFLDEARLAGRFNHPNLVQVHELTRIDGLYCLAMEYIEGEDLDNVLDTCDRRERLLDVEVAAYLIAEVAEALHYAHQLTTEDGKPLNVVHRDISPANIIVTNHGGVKLVDFGIAKSEAGSSQTQTGVVKGKFSYMSPEQIIGKRLDRRSDIFSLGAVLYESLTLERCFRRNTPMETIQAITRGEIVPVQKSRPEIPDELADITRRMMSLERDDRPPTADAVARELREFLLERRSPNPGTIRSLMHELFEATKVRGYSGIGGQETVQVTGELAGPDIDVSEAVYLEMLESQVQSVVTVPSKQPDDVADKDVPTTVRAELPTDPELLDEGANTLDLLGNEVAKAVDEPTSLVQRNSGIAAPSPMLLAATTSKNKIEKRPPWWRQPWAWAAFAGPTVLGFIIVVVATQPNESARSTVEQLPPVPAATVSSPVEPTAPDPTPAAAPVPKPTEPETRPPRKPPVKTRPRAEPAAKARPKPEPRKTEPKRNLAEAAKGILIISSDPTVTVSVDGKHVGNTPLRTALAPGSHVVRISNDGESLSRSMKIRIRAGQTLKKDLAFKKGTVMVKCTPWAQVFLRGKKLGSTPLVTQLYEGYYTLKLVSPSSGLEKLVKIIVKPGEKAKVDEKL